MTFIAKNLFYSLPKKMISFSNKNLEIILQPFKANFGQNHNQLYKLDVTFKDKNVSKSYFVKIADPKKFTSSSEFIANTIFEQFGINTIKPYMAYLEPGNHSVIIYDFTNMLNLREAQLKGQITWNEKEKILKKVVGLYKHAEKLNLGGINRMGIGDFEREDNIFVKREGKELKIYFTDLLIGQAARSY